jgi:hypothetical protein
MKKKQVCYDCHGFKRQNINKSLILTSYVYHLMPFLAPYIMFEPNIKTNENNTIFLIQLKKKKRL